MPIDPASAASALRLDGARIVDGASPMAGGFALDAPSKGGGSFEDALGAIRQAETKENEAVRLEAAFAKGEDVPLHQVMAAAEEASIAMETLAALRNRVLEAVNELTRIQV